MHNKKLVMELIRRQAEIDGEEQGCWCGINLCGLQPQDGICEANNTKPWSVPPPISSANWPSQPLVCSDCADCLLCLLKSVQTMAKAIANSHVAVGFLVWFLGLI